MGSVRSLNTSATVTGPRSAGIRRVIETVVSAVLLVAALPLIGALALAVRRSSHGPVLHRERAQDRRGRTVELLSFRTTLDGSGTTHHGRLRAVVGASDTATLTGIGRVMRATRTDRLPRLLNVLRGDASLLAR